MDAVRKSRYSFPVCLCVRSHRRSRKVTVAFPVLSGPSRAAVVGAAVPATPLGLLLFLQNHVKAGQIEIGLVKVRGHADAGLESLLRVGVSPLTDKEDS